MNHIGYLFAIVTFIATFNSLGFAAPTAISSMGTCSAPVQISTFGSRPHVLSDILTNRHFVLHDGVNGSGTRGIYYTNFGPDTMPGTADDSSGQITFGQVGGIGRDESPVTDGEWIIFRRNIVQFPQPSQIQVLLYGLGADGLPGTVDDVPETVVATYNMPPGFNFLSVTVDIRDGLAGWTLFDTFGSDFIATCDTRRAPVLQGSCSLPSVTSIPQPALVSEDVRVMRYNIFGTELHLAFATVSSVAFPVVNRYPVVVETNLGLLLPWLGSSYGQVHGFTNLLGTLQPAFTYAASGSFTTSTLVGDVLAPLSGAAIAPSIRGTPYLLDVGRHLSPTLNSEPAIWSTISNSLLFQSLGNSALKQVQFTQFNSGWRLITDRPNVDGRFVAYQHIEFLPPSSSNFYGIWVADCQ